MTEPRIDYLLQKLAKMNYLLDLTASGHDDEHVQDRRKKPGGKGEGEKGSGSFGAVGGEMFFRRNGERRAGIIGIMHPSDGHPQEELSPDFGWFRPLAHNNTTWTLYWPELIV